MAARHLFEHTPCSRERIIPLPPFLCHLRGVSRAHRGSCSRLLAHSTIGKWGKGMEAKEWPVKRAIVDSDRNSGCAQVMVSAANVWDPRQRGPYPTGPDALARVLDGR